ncbi:MAG: presenilin family intramembrane aspartyl protease PSH [Archaeoglobaceae archaeon]
MRYIFAAIFLLVNLFSVLSISPYESAGMIVFENPEDPLNPIFYLILIFSFTAVILLIAKSKLLSLILYSLTFVAIFYVLLPFIGIFSPFISAIILFLLIKRPNWMILNISAFLISVGIATMFGISLSPIFVIFLLTILAIYDSISVYKTGHMISLADSIARINVPMFFVIPKGEEKMMIGVGDMVMPAILSVSAQKFTNAPAIFYIKIPALFTILGSLFGMLFLIHFVEKRGGVHAGLPFVNAGAIAGFLISQLFEIVEL